MKSDHRSKFSNLSNWKEEAWTKNQDFNGIRTRDLRDTGAMLLRISTTSSWKTQIKCLFIPIEFWLQKKKKKKEKRQPAIPAWVQTQPSGGPYEPEALRWVTGPIGYRPPYSDTPSRLVFPVDRRMVLMMPACCVQ